MEPMTLGTPNTSFNTSVFDASNISTSQFLPSFLLGSDQDNTSSCTSPRITSPATKQQVGKSQFSPVQDSSTDRYSYQRVNFSTEKHEGPPVISLADYSLIHSLNQTSAGVDVHTTHNNSRDFIEEDTSDNWVTVFGFSASQLDLVISYFHRFGHIHDRKHSLNGGNWIHLKYSSRREAQSALSQNGKQVSSNLMIGVVSRRDKHNLDTSRHSFSLQSKSEMPVRQTMNSPPFSPTIRRLTVANSENEVVPLTNVPTKSSGVVSKTMEYLFGW